MLCNVTTLRYETQAPALAEPVGLRSFVTAPGRRNGPPCPRRCRAAGAGGWLGARPVGRKGEPTPSVDGQLRAQREGRRSLGVGAQPGAGRGLLGEPPHKRGHLRAQREGRALRWGQRPRPRPGTGGQVRYHPAQRQGPGRRPGGRAAREGNAPTRHRLSGANLCRGAWKGTCPPAQRPPEGVANGQWGRPRGRSPLEPRRGAKARGGKERSDPAPRSPVLERSDVGRRAFLTPPS